MFKIFEVFKQGKSLANAATWKNVQIATNALTVVLGFLLYVLNAFVDINITNEQIVLLAGGIAGIANVVLTITTSDKVGLPQGEGK